MTAFLADYESGKYAGRYINASLPHLPFSNAQFELALCSHYLFLYSAQVSLEQHYQSLLELCRVAMEVRVYPLVSLEGKLSEHLEPAMAFLSELKHIEYAITPVDYEFQKGAKNMLIIKHAHE